VNADDPAAIGRSEELNPTVIWRIAFEASCMICPILYAQVIDLSTSGCFRNLIGGIYGKQIRPWRHRYPVISVDSLVSAKDCPVFVRSAPTHMDVVIGAQTIDEQRRVTR
jgi:hypothetical protein